MAGGYGAGAAPPDHRWLLNTVVAPFTVTEAETFLWYRTSPRLQLGVAFLWKQEAFRWLVSYQFVPETRTKPSITASVGLQGIGTGNPGYSVTAEKNWTLAGGHGLNAFAGVGLRANEDHAHAVGGVRWSPPGPVSVGLQLDGHQGHPFVTYDQGPWIVGVYLIDYERPAFMLGLRF